MLTPDELTILRKPEVQEYIREKMGEIEPGDMYYICGEGPLITNFKHWPDKEEVIVPDCISRDSSRPERGLWGMIDWYRFHIGDSADRNGSLWVLERGCVWGTVATPYLALLRALAHQIGKVG